MLKAGEYPAQIIQVQLKVSKCGTYEQHALRVRVEDAANDHWEDFWERLTFSEGAMWKVEQVLDAVGLNSGQECDVFPGHWLDRRCRVELAERDGRRAAFLGVLSEGGACNIFLVAFISTHVRHCRDMAYYFVAKTPNGEFIGSYTIEQIAFKVQAGGIKEDYVATSGNEFSYTQLAKMGTATWVPIAELLQSAPAAATALTATTSGNKGLVENIERRSDWGTFLRVVGVINLLGSVVGFLGKGWIGLIFVGLAIQSFLFAFLVDVFTDIRWFIKKVADSR